MKNKYSLILVTFALVVAMTVSAFIVYQRIELEKDNYVVELVADMTDIVRSSQLDGVSISKVLSELKGAGVNSVAVTEQLSNTYDINLTSAVDPKKIDLYIPSKGLDASQIKMVEANGLRVIPRIRNVLNINDKKLNEKLASISKFDTVIFAEEEVLGYPSYIKDAAKLLKNANIKYGYIEFGKQLGDAKMASFSGQNIVKVHSIPAEEMEKLTYTEILERYIRAARERSIRILYVHLLQYPEHGSTLLNSNIKLVSELKTELKKADLTVGIASSPKAPAAGKISTVLIGLGIAAGIILLLSCFMNVNLAIILAILIVVPFAANAKLLALISTVVFPSYAVISQFPIKRQKIYGIISVPVLMTLSIAAITALGAIFVAGLLSTTNMMLGVDAFSGVKIAFILPILIVAGYFFLRDTNGNISIKDAVIKISTLLNMNIKVLHVMLFLAASLAAAIMILRSGNFGLPVPGAEKTIRAMLEQLMIARPRTKEFLIGYPALIIASIMYLKAQDKWLWLVLAIGVLAPISLTNTFCHIHTPLILSMIRSVAGLVLGIAFGLFLYLVFYAANKVYEQHIK